MASWYSRNRSAFWLLWSVLIIVAVWRMDAPSGAPTLVDGRVEAVEADGRLAVAIPGEIVKVDSRIPYRRGDAVKIRKYSTNIFRRTVYQLD